MAGAIGLEIALEQVSLSQLRNRLRRLDDGTMARRALEGSGRYLELKLDHYPPQKSVSRREAFGQTFQSDRQRRWFFAALKSGELRIPYKITGSLGTGWRVEIHGNEARIINRVPYAKFVQSRPQQSRQMKLIGWQTVEDIAEREGDVLWNFAFRVVAEEVRKP
jgi:hypothetical protein